MTTPTAPTIEEMRKIRDGLWCAVQERALSNSDHDMILDILESHAEVVKERDRLLLERDDARWQVKNLVGYIDELRDDRKKAESEAKELREELERSKEKK